MPNRVKYPRIMPLGGASTRVVRGVSGSEGASKPWQGGWFRMRKSWNWVDWTALLLAILTLGVIVAILAQNFLNLE